VLAGFTIRNLPNALSQKVLYFAPQQTNGLSWDEDPLEYKIDAKTPRI